MVAEVVCRVVLSRCDVEPRLRSGMVARPCRSALVAFVVSAASANALNGAEQAPWSWCAPPRTPEPLLADAREHAAGETPSAQVFRRANALPVVDVRSVEIVKDEGVCRRAAEAYRPSHARTDPKWPLRPVIIARVGPLYMVDDQRNRRGRGATWAVLVYSSDFKERHGHFGDGY